MHQHLLYIIVTSLLLYALPAESKEDIESLLNEFKSADSNYSSNRKQTAAAADKKPYKEIFSASGSLGLETVFNTAHKKPAADKPDQRRFSSLKTRLDLDLRVKLMRDWRFYISGSGWHDFIYGLKGRSAYSREYLRHYESQAELGELWAGGSIAPGLVLKTGRQIITVGKADTMRIIDIVNPLDMRLPGLADIRDLKLPLALTKLEYGSQKISINACMIHEIRFNKEPLKGSDFYYEPTNMLLPVKEKTPAHGGKNSEAVINLNIRLPAADMGWHYSYFFDDMPAVKFELPAAVKLFHPRLHLWGASLNAVSGSWSFKMESALVHGIEFIRDYPGLTNESFTRLDLMAGVEYTGVENLVLALESADRYILNFNKELEGMFRARENEFSLSLRCKLELLREKLTLEILALHYGLRFDGGGWQRFTAVYDAADRLNLTLGFINYVSGEQFMFDNIGNNDRLFAKADYYF